eukprot:CAMPEP_0179372752 /NCGR_PEP_ID=MMETSP0797-20121207/86457_1 /TAXON_ID=47934 /ORGANISM="Dinophysis acuminata, Strain DAEP01" /LENGTH=54 /DNA_ID=CAMNT_0021088753 /DNA_START=75 /DNA_END=236 /DNA_ORIENTATION=-
MGSSPLRLTERGGGIAACPLKGSNLDGSSHGAVAARSSSAQLLGRPLGPPTQGR